LKNINGRALTGEVPLDTVLELEVSDLRPDFGQAEFATTQELEPRSYASLQLRAGRAVKQLLASAHEQVLVICGNIWNDQPEIACDLVARHGGRAVLVKEPDRELILGSKKNGKAGLLDGSGILIMPCSHFIDHPKWIGRAEAKILSNKNLKLIFCGDATDCTQLELMWPFLNRALHTELVSEFSADNGLFLMGGMIAAYCARAKLKPFDREAVALLCMYSCRQSSSVRWLGILQTDFRSLLQQADAYAEGPVVTRANLLKAIAAKDFRENYIAESELREHRDMQILMETSGQTVGQINGLSVVETAGTSYEYGSPVRITATLRAGGEGDVVDIERKAELAGQIHAKAMMIINGFISNEFAYDQGLPISASLVFEQSYSEIDGDSASLTGLCAVLSAMSELPIRQDLAVTGSVDQFGDIQPVGGVNEKIEGFFKICRLRGLSGTQGVIIPASCVPQLVLKPAVVKAIAQGKFHIYAVAHVTGAMKLLTSCDWGDYDTENTIVHKIGERIDAVSQSRSLSAHPWWHFWG